MSFFIQYDPTEVGVPTTTATNYSRKGEILRGGGRGMAKEMSEVTGITIYLLVDKLVVIEMRRPRNETTIITSKYPTGHVGLIQLGCLKKVIISSTGNQSTQYNKSMDTIPQCTLPVVQTGAQDKIQSHKITKYLW